MSHTLPWFIGFRYTRSKRRNGFIAFVSLFALLGMGLGVFALIVVLSVMNGFDHELKQRILRAVPHGYVSEARGVDDWQSLASSLSDVPHLDASAPYIEGSGLAAFSGSVKGIELQGVAPEYEKNVSLIDDFMLIGQLDDLQPGQYGIVLGSLLARNIGVNRGDKVSVTLPLVSVSPAGVFPRSKRFTVIGMFEVGAQIDQTLALIHLQDAQKLFRLPGKVEGLRLKFDDIYAASEGVRAVARTITASGIAPDKTFEVKDWSQTQGSLFQAVKMEKTVVGVMLAIIVAVAAFNIVTSLIMMVAEKRSDIAVLRTLGMNRWAIVKIFMVQGTTMGVVGISVGALLGIITAQNLPQLMAWLESAVGLQIFDPDIYFVAYLPSLWVLEDTLWVIALASVTSLLATIYPAYRASTIAPAEALRYDT